MADPRRFFKAASALKASRPARLRLFPAVGLAAAALLVLKSVDLLQNPETNRSTLGVALERRANQKYDPETTGSTTPAKKKEEKADSKADPKVDPATAPGAKAVAADGPAPLSAAEKSLLQRLGDRREQLDDRQRELDTREQLLKAADKKLEAKINELKSMEYRPSGQSDAAAAPGAGGAPAGAPAAAGPAGAPEQGGLKNIVTMYEAMKPKDAAKVFDRLDMKVLVPVVNAMNPRKMSEVLAAMSPEAAERLTVELARPSLRSPQPQANSRDVLPAGELPSIEPRKP
jgi:flagellar motility protein MotE (MotC chaperone)